MRVTSYVPSEEIFQVNNNTSKTNTVKDGNEIENFSNVLGQALNKVNDQQIVAENMNTSLVKGEDASITDVMLAGEEAKISLQFAVQVRNKLLDAYKELTEIQL
ncbi:MAG: flagellar hook-basal body complex protein FliE [Clostridium sp.]|nr:flagellar hook-basal body complex protein FliE [Clostridium sp.]